MMGQKCYKNGDCRCKGYDGICFYGKSCVYKNNPSTTQSVAPLPLGKGDRNKAQKSPVSNFAKNVPNYPSKNI